MSAPDDDQLAELAARLSAEDPAFTRQFTPDTAPRSSRGWVVITGSVVAALLLAGMLLGDVPLALMALPVSATVALLGWAQRWNHAWRLADRDGPARPGPTAS